MDEDEFKKASERAAELAAEDCERAIEAALAFGEFTVPEEML